MFVLCNDVRETGSIVVTRQVVTVAFSQKLEDSRSSRLYWMKNISNQLCMRNLEIICDNKKKLWPKNGFFTPPGSFFYIFEICTLRQEYPPTSGNWQSREMKYTCSIYIDGIITALCAWVFDWQVLLLKIPPWGKFLHCNCNTWGIKWGINWLKMQPNHSCH